MNLILTALAWTTACHRRAGNQGVNLDVPVRSSAFTAWLLDRNEWGKRPARNSCMAGGVQQEATTAPTVTVDTGCAAATRCWFRKYSGRHKSAGARFALPKSFAARKCLRFGKKLPQIERNSARLQAIDTEAVTSPTFALC